MTFAKTKSRILTIIVAVLIVFSLMPTSVFAADDGRFSVHFIDVGQGDAILIKNQGMSMLIDGGDSIAKNNVVLYLRNQNIQKLDYIIATHPHSDHIGKLDDVIYAFDVDNLFMPRIPDQYVPTTKVYEEFLTAIKTKQVKVNQSLNGLVFYLGDAKVELFQIDYSGDNLNDYSTIARITHGEKTFLFTGDAERAIEKGLLEERGSVKSDLLKVGHHGSKTSSDPKFLKTVAPSIGVISVGENNKFSHPDVQTVEDLQNNGIRIYETRISGNIVAYSDKKNITIEVQNKPASTLDQLVDGLVKNVIRKFSWR